MMLHSGNHGTVMSSRTSALSMTVLMIVAAVVVVVDAYPSGPPLTSCSSMRPTGHGTSTVTGIAPYTITTSKSSYAAGDEIEVTISGGNFIGFFLQARRRDSGADSSTAVGSFSSIDTTLTKVIACGGSASSAWSHRSNALKSSVTATWTTPDDEGTIAFRATIVQGPSSDKYWTDLYSDEISSGSAGSNTTGVMETQTERPATTDAGDAINSSTTLIVTSLCGAMVLRVVMNNFFW
ncbi:putative defense protein 3 [Diadema setosum]|uniref:putative defense protein 3 n=1 Tax=Diadema setosum TaxID=31175 RepID=UPI003B3AFCD2